MSYPLYISQKTEKNKLEVQLKEAYKKLYDSENYLRAIIESSLDGIAVVDEQGNIEFANDSFFNIVGWPRDELIGQSFNKMLTDDTREPYIKIWHDAQNSIPYTGKVDEAKIKTKDGEIKYLYKSRVGIVINGMRKFVFIAKDISEKKRLELNLKESEAKYRELFENANEMILIGDKDGYVLDVNNAIIRTLGCTTKDEVIGTHFSDWYTPESCKIAQNNQNKYLSGEQIKQPQILEFICKNGEHRWAEVRSRIIKQGDKALGIHAIARDITEKIRLEQELKESEAKYRELFENAQDAMYVLDIEGNILKMNLAGLRILDCEKEEVIGSNISKWLTPESLEIVQERRKKCLSGKTVNKTDILEIVSKNGEHRWVEIKTRGIKDGDRAKEIHGIARDITENILLRQELKRSNKQRKLLCYLIEGTRGGKTRALILKHLIDRSYNAHQLAKILNMDYKTIRHHLEVLIKNGIIARGSDGYTSVYFLSKHIELNLNEFNHELQHSKS